MSRNPKFPVPITTLALFRGQEKDGELSFDANEIFTAVEANDSGWWYCKNEEKQGWAPSTYLKIQKADILKKKGSMPLLDRNTSTASRLSGKEIKKINKDLNKMNINSTSSIDSIDHPYFRLSSSEFCKKLEHDFESDVVKALRSNNVSGQDLHQFNHQYLKSLGIEAMGDRKNLLELKVRVMREAMEAKRKKLSKKKEKILDVEAETEEFGGF